MPSREIARIKSMRDRSIRGFPIIIEKRASISYPFRPTGGILLGKRAFVQTLDLPFERQKTTQPSAFPCAILSSSTAVGGSPGNRTRLPPSTTSPGGGAPQALSGEEPALDNAPVNSCAPHPNPSPGRPAKIDARPQNWAPRRVHGLSHSKELSFDAIFARSEY